MTITTLEMYLKNASPSIRDRAVDIVDTTKLIRLLLADLEGCDWRDIPLDVVLPAAIVATQETS